MTFPSFPHLFSRLLSIVCALIVATGMGGLSGEAARAATADEPSGPIANGSAAVARFPSLRWLHAGADPVQQLASQPVECVDLSGAPEHHALVEAGRLLFRHPVVLGGWAADLGLSCESCHAGGRAHAQFHLAGRSDAPGSVDLDLADGFDPRPIPPVLDLAIGQEVEARLTRHIAGDFGPVALPGGALTALVAYLGALSSPLCPERDRAPRSVGDDLYEISRLLNSVQYYLQENNEEMAAVMGGALRGQVAHLRTRFAALPDLRGAITGLLDTLPDGGAQSAPGGAEAEEDARVALRRWHRRWLGLTPRLLAAGDRSLYARERLEEWLRGR